MPSEVRVDLGTQSTQVTCSMRENRTENCRYQHTAVVKCSTHTHTHTQSIAVQRSSLLRDNIVAVLRLSRIRRCKRNRTPFSRGGRNSAETNMPSCWPVLTLNFLPPEHRAAYVCNTSISAGRLVFSKKKNENKKTQFARCQLR